MVGHQSARSRSADHAWLITGPLALVTVVAVTVLWIHDDDWYLKWPQGLLLFVAYIAAYVGVLNFTIRRSVFNVVLTDIPFLLAFHFLPPVMVILMVSAACAIVQIRTVSVPVKRWFNVAKSAASVTVALLV